MKKSLLICALIINVQGCSTHFASDEPSQDEAMAELEASGVERLCDIAGIKAALVQELRQTGTPKEHVLHYYHQRFGDKDRAIEVMETIINTQYQQPVMATQEDKDTAVHRAYSRTKERCVSGMTDQYDPY